jgi:hypothetical protein
MSWEQCQPNTENLNLTVKVFRVWHVIGCTNLPVRGWDCLNILMLPITQPLPYVGKMWYSMSRREWLNFDEHPG